MTFTPVVGPTQTGSNDKVSDALQGWINATWGDNAGNAQGAVVVFWMNAYVTTPSTNLVFSPEIYLFPNTSSADDRFVIGSVQKVFTGAMLAGRIVQGAKNDPPYTLDANVSTWLPVPQTGTAPIYSATLAQLATMSACMSKDAPGQDEGLYCSGGPPGGDLIKKVWLDDNPKYWLQKCQLGQDYNYSNWGSVTLAFAISQPDGYVYDTTLTNLIVSNFPGVSSEVTNTCNTPACVQGYQGDGATPATGVARGIRTSISELTNFFNYFAYNWLGADYQPSIATSFVGQMVATAMTQPASVAVPWALDWGIRKNFGPASNTMTLYDKDGVSGKQGFSAYVGLLDLPPVQPAVMNYPIGVLVMVNKIWGDGRPCSPTAFGRQLLTMLLGGMQAPAPACSSAAGAEDCIVDMDDADPV